ncbi:MAG: hypothetical protein PHR71_12260 [Polaromonas sp.]|nr:hypothetical protein [Polaromonas sp.]
MKIAIEKNKDARMGIRWTACEPFIENSMAVLIHRVRRVTTHKIGDRWKAHISVHCWCGNSMSGTKKFTFLDAPPEGRIVCGRCEDFAIKAGKPTSEQLTGRHIHTGGVIAVRRCCEEKDSIAKATGSAS